MARQTTTHARASITDVVPDEVTIDAGELARMRMRLDLLEAFADASSDAFFSQGPDGRIVTFSRTAERIFGFAATEIIGGQAEILFPEHLREDMRAIFAAVAAGDKVHRAETELQRRDGLPIVVALTISPIVDCRGAVAGAVAVAQDVTEARLAQAALAEVEARLGEGEALAHVGRWMWDVGTGAVQWSDELHRIHGVDPRDFAGTFDAHVLAVHPADRERVRAGMLAAVASGRRFEDEYRVVRPDGSLRWVYARAEPMVGSTNFVVGLQGIGQDVTDRRTASA